MTARDFQNSAIPPVFRLFSSRFLNRQSGKDNRKLTGKEAQNLDFIDFVFVWS
jgi:hypothetical protein